ncbi:hypothetical protein GCM10018952_60220 [Streptosporangium vulgare]
MSWVFCAAAGVSAPIPRTCWGAVRSLNRAEFVGEVMRSALNALAAAAPGWLAGWAPATWQERYGQRVDAYRLPDREGRPGCLAVAGRRGWSCAAGADL